VIPLSVDDWSISTTVSGPVVVGLLGNIGLAVWNLWRTNQAKTAATRLEKKVTPVSNGFADEVKATLQRVESKVEKLNDRFTDHLELHAERKDT
jgi:predicted negative regulator of RcsB-dependent stress response